MGLEATAAITSPVEVSSFWYLQASLVPVMDSKPSRVPEPASRPMKTTWPSVPPTSAQLVISPVASWAICSTLRSATGLLGLTMMAMPSLATVMALTPVSSSFRSREARPMSQVPSWAPVTPALEPEPV